VFKPTALFIALNTLFITSALQAAPQLIAIGTLNSSSAGANKDLSGLNNILENGVSGNNLGGIGSGLAWAGGNTFLAVPDRGPNATAYAGGAVVDNTSSYVARFQTLNLTLTPSASGSALPYTLTPLLTGTTLLSSPTALNYGSTAGLPNAIPANNTANQNFFTGRSDGFVAGLSTNPNNARLDPEAIRVSNDGKTVFIADEYGPYVRQFDRTSGQLVRTYNLPNTFAVSNQTSTSATEISGNTSGRVTNKGMEGLAITPDGKKLIGFMQSPLIQDGGDGGQYNRIVTIDIASGAVQQFAYNNKIGSKTYNSSEILAVNDKQFLVLERDGKGLGDGSTAVIKQLQLVDLTNAQDVSNVSGATALAALAVNPSLFLDLRAALNAIGITDDQIPAKLEGAAFGDDILIAGQLKHTLFIANDNDFIPDVAGPNKFFAFAFSDADLPGFQNQKIATVPVPASAALVLLGLGFVGRIGRTKTATARTAICFLASNAESFDG
jgi:Esterase-like activity of phytase